jgi:hypothetical protein
LANLKLLRLDIIIDEQRHWIASNGNLVTIIERFKDEIDKVK